MANFLSPEEAAKRLGITTDELTQLRERREIFGVRDGAGWKYREDEIQRYLEEHAAEAAEADAGEGGGSALQLGEPAPAGESDSVLLSEEALGQSSLSSSPSTVIGAQGAEATNPESDLQLEEEPTVLSEPGGSDVTLVPSSEGGSDVALVPTPNPAGEASDLALADLDELGQTPGPVQETPQAESEQAGATAQDDELPPLLLEDEQESPAAESGSPQAAEELDVSIDTPAPKESQQGDSALEFGASDLVLGESVAGASDPLLAGSAGVITPQPGGGAEDFDEDDLVLGESSESPPATPGLSDSGISLGTADDSGLSLEEPLDLDAEELIPSDSSGEVEDLPSEDEFNLTPALELDDQDTESGSQVIALDDEPFDAESQTVLSQQPQPEAAVAPVPMPVVAPEAPFSGWTVTGLAFLTIFMAITGMMMFDLVMHMWSWDGPYTYNSSLMDLVLGLFEG